MPASWHSRLQRSFALARSYSVLDCVLRRPLRLGRRQASPAFGAYLRRRTQHEARSPKRSARSHRAPAAHRRSHSPPRPQARRSSDRRRDIVFQLARARKPGPSGVEAWLSSATGSNAVNWTYHTEQPTVALCVPFSISAKVHTTTRARARVASKALREAKARCGSAFSQPFAGNTCRNAKLARLLNTTTAC